MIEYNVFAKPFGYYFLPTGQPFECQLNFYLELKELGDNQAKFLMLAQVPTPIIEALDLLRPQVSFLSEFQKVSFINRPIEYLFDLINQI